MGQTVSVHGPVCGAPVCNGRGCGIHGSLQRASLPPHKNSPVDARRKRKGGSSGGREEEWGRGAEQESDWAREIGEEYRQKRVESIAATTQGHTPPGDGPLVAQHRHHKVSKHGNGRPSARELRPNDSPNVAHR